MLKSFIIRRSLLPPKSVHTAHACLHRDVARRLADVSERGARTSWATPGGKPAIRYVLGRQRIDFKRPRQTDHPQQSVPPPLPIPPAERLRPDCRLTESRAIGRAASLLSRAMAPTNFRETRVPLVVDSSGTLSGGVRSSPGSVHVNHVYHMTPNVPMKCS